MCIQRRPSNNDPWRGRLGVIRLARDDDVLPAFRRRCLPARGLVNRTSFPCRQNVISSPLRRPKCPKRKPGIADLIGCGQTESALMVRPEGGIMRATTITLSLVSLLLIGVFSLSLAQTTQAAATQPVPWHPCARIAAACTQAGFVPNGAKVGLGIAVDCIRPIIVGTPQRKEATKALPEIDPQVVAACKMRNPNFGENGGQPLFALRTPR